MPINPEDIIWDDKPATENTEWDKPKAENIEWDKPKRQSANQMVEGMMSQIVGLDRQPPGQVAPFEARHPNIAATGQAIRDIPGQVDELGKEIVAGATWGASERVEEAAQYLSEQLFGKSERPKKEPAYLPGYIRTAAKVGGGMATIGGTHKIVATPMVQLISKSKYLKPFAEMIGWGATGSTYQGVSTMIQEGELPTMKELAKHGAQWAVVSGVFSMLGWTGRLSAGVERLHKLWKIPRKEVLKTVIKEAKLRKMPVAKYTYAKAGAQKALSAKEAESANELLHQIGRTAKHFKKRGVYSDLVKQIEDKDIKARISAFRKHIGETKIIGERPKPVKVVVEPEKEIERILSKPAFQRSAEDIALLNKKKSSIKVVSARQPKKVSVVPVKYAGRVTKKTKHLTPKAFRHEQILKEDLPGWIKRTGDDIRLGSYVSKKNLQEYKDFFKDRPGLYKPQTEKYPVVKVLSKPTKNNRVTLESPWGKKGPRVLKEDLPQWVRDTGQKIRYGDKLSQTELKRYQGYFKNRPGMYAPNVVKEVPKKAIPTAKLKAALVYPNGKVVKGRSHLDCLEQAEKLGLDKLAVKSSRPIKEGFVDTSGKFLSRAEAKLRYGSGESFKLQESGVVDKTPKGGVHLGFGFTGELQRIFEKIRGVKVYKQSKIKMADVVKKAPSKEAQLLMKALKEAKVVRGKQEQIYTEARGIKLADAQAIAKKTSGRSGFFAEKRALSGKMPRAEFTPIINKLKPEAVDKLFDQIKHCPTLQAWEVFPARTAFEQLLGGHGGTVPTKGGLKLLREVFGPELVTTLEKLSSHKVRDFLYHAINIPKAMRASYDVSAGLRQGLFLIGHPKRFATAFKKQFKPLVSTKAFNEIQTEIKKRPSYELMVENKLSLTDLGSLSKREEAFASNLAEKIPGIKASSRAFTAFLNRLRADVFDDFVTASKKLRIDDPKYLQDAAKYINHATGRGHLLKLEHNAVELNLALFSPRLVMSRLQLLNPWFYKHLHPKVRKTALKDLFTLASTLTTTCILGKLGGLKVGVDPRNADFAKLRVGNVRYDIAGGFQQPLRLAAQFLSGVYINSTTGKPETLGIGYKPLTRIGIVGRFGKGKLSPAAAFIMTLMSGQSDAEGRVDIPSEVLELVTPMALQDLYDLYNERGKEGIPMATPAFFGVGVQTYGGVANYGLDGKDYPALNKELNRLKTSIGFPSINVYSQELSAKDYWSFRYRSGTRIAGELTKTLKAPYYQKATDNEKKYIIASSIDRIKNDLKSRMFPKQRQIADLAKNIKGATLMDYQDAIVKAKKQLTKKR
jgi:hypothetical protein